MKKIHYEECLMSTARLFHQIDIANVENKSNTTKKIAEINVFEFLYQYISCGNFYDAVEKLENLHHSMDFKVGLSYLKLFHVIQNKEDVKKILSANTTSGYQNHNFDVSHGHDLNINATQAFLNKSGTEKN